MGACLNGSPDENPNPAEEEKTDGVEKIKNVASVYKFGRTLGSGASCRVVEATNKNNDKEKCAIKIMDKDRLVTGKLYTREVQILQKLTPNVSQPQRGILPFMGYGEDDDAYYIVTRLMFGGELFDRIVSKDDEYKITEKIAVKLVLNMLEAVKFCHDNNVVHRDLKPENFVFASTSVDSDIVLIDYGCARIVDDAEEIKDVVGTAYYLAPELAVAALDGYRKKGKRISPDIPPPQPRTGKILRAADVWGMGVIAYVMMTGRAPFRGRDNQAIFESSVLKPVTFPEKDARYRNKLQLSDHFKDFIQRTLIKDPSKRISIDEAIRHPWVQGVDASDYRLNRDVIECLRQFTYQSRLKKEITRVLAANMTQEPSKQVRKHFERLDADGDGFLDLDELTLLLLDMGYPKHNAKDEAGKIIQEADKNGDGVVDFEEFKQVWYRNVLTTNDQYIHRVFDVFDDNGDGAIDAAELKLVLFSEDNKENEDEESPLKEEENKSTLNQLQDKIRNMISEVDENGDGKIDFEEFKKAMKEDQLQFGAKEDGENYGGLIGPKIVE
eukprot:106541_1